MDPNTTTLEDHVRRAVAGDPDSLERVLSAIKDDIYGLAIRMLGHPADAEDATQEILLRVCTSLASYEHRSAFRTWVYRVAVRGLLNVRRGRREPPALSFDAFAAGLEANLDMSASLTPSTPEQVLLAREVRLSCTQGLLMCLDREHRMAYLLAECFELTGREGAQSLEIAEATFRKRVSRARQRMERFMGTNCGLVSETARCRCPRQVAAGVEAGQLDPSQLLFAQHPTTDATREDAEGAADYIRQLKDAATVMRRSPRYAAPARLHAGIIDLLKRQLLEPSSGRAQ